jgi:uncharacterized delta-60 repeat protein
MRALLFAACFVLPAAWGADGDIDHGFGTNGHVVFAPVDAGLSAFAVAVADDDRIIVGGSRWAFAAEGKPNQAVVWRLLANGAPDLSFGEDGIGVIPASPGSPVLPAIWSVLPLHDGRVLAAGNLGGFGVARLRADGSLDTSFGVGGVATIAFDDLGVQDANVFAIARDGANHILLAGTGNAGGASSLIVGVAARFSMDGMPDTQFASAGRFVLAPGNPPTQRTTSFFGVAGDASGRVWLSGGIRFVPDSANRSALAVRLLADGMPDTTFGSGGIVAANRYVGSDDNMSAGVLRDGRWTIGGVCDPYAGSPALCVLRIDADGQVDTGFGNAGWASVPLGQTTALRGSAMACGADGRCVLLGSVLDPTTSRRQFAVLRVDPDGTPDVTFGNAGVARIAVPADVDGSQIIARAITLQDGRPVPVGTTDGVPYVSALYATRLESNAIFEDGFETE